MSHSISIVITTFNGKNLLKKHLPQVIKNSPGVKEIIVVDDGGKDSTQEFLTQNYPQVTYIKNKKNLGFVKSTNIGVSLSSANYVVLLNNDVSPQKNYLKNAIKHFKDQKVFAVSFNEKESSWPNVSWQNGKLHFTRGKDKSIPRYSAWFSGGSAIIDKDIWDKLGGMNEIYSPGYWEDIDISWRAWKKGYKIIWEPTAKVSHQHESTFKNLKKSYTNKIRQRNELLFHWQNITDRKLALSHYKFLVNYAIKHPGYLKIIIAAIIKYPILIKNRLQNRKQAQLSDQQVLENFNKII